jgi:hypothetical protein
MDDQISDSQHSTVYYSRPTRVASILAVVVSALFDVGVVIWAWLQAPLAGLLLAVLMILSLAWLSLSLLRMGTYVREDHLVVRTNLARTIRLPWDDIEDFEIGGRGSWPDYHAVFARLRSGRVVRMYGTTSSPYDRDNADRSLASLRVTLASHR